MLRRTLLDPKLDIVFKMLFTDPRNRDLLCRFVQDFLQPATPIADIEVLNPELRRVSPGERGAEVDLLVCFDGGKRAHVEIQLSPRDGFIGRSLFYWARAFTRQLSRGAPFSDLEPTTGIFILDYHQLPTEQYYNVFQLTERSRGTELTDLLCLQYLELPKIPRDLLAAQPGPAVLKWAAYLAARSDEELAQIAMTDPTIHDAVTALKRQSEDPDAQEAAYLRAIEVSDFNARLLKQRAQGRQEGIAEGIVEGRREGIATGRQEGIATGRQEGIATGRQEGIAAAIDSIRGLCAQLDIELDEERERQLNEADLKTLLELFGRIAASSRWPE
jgi:predicted transposase/invertase (TIGR01784 family)